MKKSSNFATHFRTDTSMEQTEDSRYQHSKKWLHIVLILSMIGTGLSAISNLIVGLTLSFMREVYGSGSVPIPSEMAVAFEQMLEAPKAFYLWSSLVYAMAFAGTILMWNLRKNGFHFYTLGKLLVYVVTLLFLGKGFVNLGDLMLTLLFVMYYFVTLKSLGVFDNSQPQEENADDGGMNTED